MKSDLKTRHGGKILADALAAQGVKLITLNIHLEEVHRRAGVLARLTIV